MSSHFSVHELQDYLEAHPDERPTADWSIDAKSKLFGLPGKHYHTCEEWKIDFLMIGNRVRSLPPLSLIKSLYEFRMKVYRQGWKQARDVGNELLVAVFVALADEAKEEKESDG